MRKEWREAERIILSLGFRIVETGRTKHHYWILESPSGKRFKQPISHCTGEGRFWLNFKTQLRKHLSDSVTVNPRRAEPRRTSAADMGAKQSNQLDVLQRKGTNQ